MTGQTHTGNQGQCRLPVVRQNLTYHLSKARPAGIAIFYLLGCSEFLDGDL